MSPLEPPAQPSLAPLRPLTKGTLSRRLVLQTALLVAVIAVVLSVMSSLAVSSILTANVDDQLRASMEHPGPGRRGMGRQDAGQGTGGLPGGSLVIQQTGDLAVGQLVTQWEAPIAPTEDQMQAVMDVPDDGKVYTRMVPGLGVYRAISATSPQGSTIVAIPLTQVNQVVSAMVRVEILLTAVVVVAAAVVAWAGVQRSLRRLNRLAQTATTVSTMPLDRGEVQLPSRLAEQDADPRNEVGRVGLAFNHMLDNVEAALASRHRSETRVRQFVADASHELRNPLASIRGYAELTRRSGDDLPADTAFSLSRIESESERMSKLVDELLLLARLDAGPNLQPEPIDLTPLVLNATSDARAAGPQHRWSLSLPEDPVTVMADANQLQQLVSNLLSNARKHTPPGTRVDVVLSVTDAAPGAGQAVIAVSDNGPGIPPEVRDHVFERFARADAARRYDTEGSTGLGLAIVQAVTLAHGGHVHLESQPGCTCFTITLPLAGR